MYNPDNDLDRFVGPEGRKMFDKGSRVVDCRGNKGRVNFARETSCSVRWDSGYSAKYTESQARSNGIKLFECPDGRAECGKCGCMDAPDTGEQLHFVDCPDHADWVAERHIEWIAQSNLNRSTATVESVQRVAPISQLLTVFRNVSNQRVMLDWAIRTECTDSNADALDLAVAAIIRHGLFLAD